MGFRPNMASDMITMITEILTLAYDGMHGYERVLLSCRGRAGPGRMKRARYGIGLQVDDRAYRGRDCVLGPRASGGVNSGPMCRAGEPGRAAAAAGWQGPIAAKRMSPSSFGTASATCYDFSPAELRKSGRCGSSLRRPRGSQDTSKFSWSARQTTARTRSVGPEIWLTSIHAQRQYGMVEQSGSRLPYVSQVTRALRRPIDS
jgi:hypothetical protein